MRIALVGGTHAGKTTVARYLATKYGFAIVSIEAEVKRLAAHMVDEFLRRTHIKDEQCVIPITEFSWLIEGVRNHLAPTVTGNRAFWADQVIRACDERSLKRAVCDDVTFFAEAGRLSENGFVLIRIERPRMDRVNSLISTHAKNSGSVFDGFSLASERMSSAEEHERENIPYNYLLRNTTRIEALYSAVDNLMTTLGLSNEPAVDQQEKQVVREEG